MNKQGASSVSFIKESFLNAGFDEDDVQKSIDYGMNSSYKNLYQLQRNMTGFDRWNLTTADIKMSGTSLFLSIPRDLIDPIRRNQYRKSNFYNRELTLDEINNNRSVFLYIPLLFIDGQSSFAYTVKTTNDKTDLVLKMNKSIMSESHQYTILFIYNNGLVEVKSNKYVLDKYSNDLPASLFGTRVIDQSGVNLAFVSGDGEVTGSSFNQVTDGATSSYINMTAFTNQIIASNGSLSIKVINFRFIYSLEKIYKVKQKADSSLGCELCVINSYNGKEYDMPIPEENVLVLKYNSAKSDYLVDNNVSAKLHYPNIYEIQDPTMTLTDTYKVFYFYYTDPADISYRNRIHPYQLLMERKQTGNMYFRGPLFNLYNLIATYDVETDVFKDVCGITNALKITPPSPKTINMSYCNFIDPVKFEAGKTYTLVCYAYNSIDCDSDLRIRLEGDFVKIGDSAGSVNQNTVNTLKGVPQLMWVTFKALNNVNPTKLLIYPSFLAETGVFTTGYQLYTGIQIYEGDYVKLPSNNNFEDVVNDVWFGTVSKETYPYLNLFDGYFNYTDDEYVFNNSDYINTLYPNYYDYKVNKFKDFYRNDISLLSHYQKKHDNPADHFSLYVKNINLTERVRNDNHAEVSNSKKWVTFTEPHYVFTFTNEGLYDLNIHFFIDGEICAYVKSIRDKDYEFFYVPTRLINAQSYIEIEAYRLFNHVQTIKFTDINNYVSVNLQFPTEEFAQPLTSDVYFTYHDNVNLIDKSKFELSMMINNERVVLDDFNRLVEFDVKLLDETLVNTDITLHIQKMPQFHNFIAENDGYATIKLTADAFNPRREFFRVYRNGRLLLPEYWVLDLDKSTRELKILTKIFTNESISVDILPHYFSLVYSQDLVPSGKYIDLRGIIDKPFDLQYYEVYVNGRKLTEANVFAISPTKIVLKNLNSMKHLRIFQKDRSSEYFQLYDTETPKMSVVDELLDDTVNLTENDKSLLIDELIKEICPSDVTVIADNVDTEPDINNGILITPEDVEMNAFYEVELKGLGHLNPDLVQFNYYTIIAEYPDIKPFMESASNAVTNPNVIKFNPDINVNNASLILKVGNTN